MAVPAPRIETTRTGDLVHDVASLAGMAGDLDLTTISGKPKHAAQLVRLNNATGAALSAVLTPEKGSDVTVVVNAGQQYETPFAVKVLVKSGSGALSAIIVWWLGNSGEINK